MARPEVEEAARRTGEDTREKAESGSGWYAVLARSGLVAKGISYGLVGVLAIKLAVGDGGKATSRQGALQTLSQHTFGKAVLVLLACGLAGYAVWRFIEAAVERDDDGGKGAVKTWGKRAGYVGRGLIYAGLTFSTVKILLGSGGGQSQSEKAHQTTATVFDWPGGRWLVGVAGIVLVGVGLWNAYRGISQKFADKWRTGGMSRAGRTWAERVGVIGHLARGVVLCLIGIFITTAAVEFDSRDAIGLDGALHKLAQASYGPYLLGITAAGLVCYGVYCLVDARYRDVSAGSGGGRTGGAREKRLRGAIAR
jgi:hypothetical protein